MAAANRYRYGTTPTRRIPATAASGGKERTPGTKGW